MRSTWVGLAVVFVVAAGATVGVTAALDGGSSDSSSGVVVGAPVAVYGPVDGVLGPDPAPASDDPGSGSGTSGGGGTSDGGSGSASADPSAAVSLLEPLVDADGARTGEARFIDPCAPPDGDAGCDGTTASITGSDEAPPFAFHVYPDRCGPGDPIYSVDVGPDAGVLPPTGNRYPVGTPFGIQSTAPVLVDVTAGLEPGASDVTARAETEPSVQNVYVARLSSDDPPDVVTCIGIPFPDRTGLWVVDFMVTSLINGESETVELTYDTTSSRPRPPVIVEPPSDFTPYFESVVRVTAPAFDHPTDRSRSREPSFDLVPGDGVSASCRERGSHPIDAPDLSSSEGPRRVPRADDATSPYDPGWDRGVTATFSARRLEPATSYVVCVDWENGRGEVVERVAIPIVSPNRISYRAELTDIRFRDKTVPSALKVKVFGFCVIIPSVGPRPQPVRHVAHPDASACRHDELRYPRGSLVGVDSDGPAVPVILTVPQGEVTRFIALPGNPCGPEAAGESCGPLEFSEEFELPLVDIDPGICGSGFPGRSCRNHRTAGRVTLRVTIESSPDPNAGATWLVGNEVPPGDELTRTLEPCRSGCSFEAT